MAKMTGEVVERYLPGRREQTGRTALLLWTVGPVFELPVAALAISSFPDVAAEAVFGTAGSQALVILALVLVLAGAALAWAGSFTTGPRLSLAVLLWVASGLLAVLMLGYLASGTWAVFAILLAHSAVAAAVIGWMLARRPAPAQPSRLAR
ncbi:hypothetical protein AB0L86_29860 [Micromonospora musae]|uniref:hypothetical protein n=1 Tax=Micromonospora musae TaxID=1894970 RepID=UPI00344A6091